MSSSTSSRPAAPPPQSNPYEPHPDTSLFTPYVPNPDSPTAIPTSDLSPSHNQILSSILKLYSAHPSESAVRVYSPSAVFEDPFSYCDNRYKIAGQWYGLPKVFPKCEVKALEVVKATEEDLWFKLRVEYGFVGGLVSKTVDSLVSLRLVREKEREEEDGSGEEELKVKYHKDQWFEADYSHEGLVMAFRKLNGDHLAKITKPPEGL